MDTIKQKHIVIFGIGILFLILFIGYLNQPSKVVNTTTTYAYSLPSPTNIPSPTPTPSPVINLYTENEYTPGSNCPEYVSSDFQVNESLVCVSTGDWRGYLGVNSIPIIGKVYGKVKFITVDGQEITWDDNSGEVYTRINLLTQYGLNQYKVKAEDAFGDTASANLYMTVVKPSDSSN